MSSWASMSREELLDKLKTNPSFGLDQEEVAGRLAKYGPNRLIEEEPPGVLRMLLAQFKDFLVVILLISLAVAASLGETIDAVVILAIVVLNAVLGVVQERKAERALTGLRHLSVPEATVIRGGSRLRVPGTELVPGDLVILQAGDIIPADIRLLEAVNLKTDESPLTGESIPVEKNAAFIAPQDAATADQQNMVFLGTTTTDGRGQGVVVRTGTHTEVGKIAALVAAVEDRETPLQRRLSQFGRWLGMACLGICAMVFTIGVLRGEELFEMFMTAVSLAVAAIPEGLPALVAIVLALGVQRMIAKRAIIRRLPAVETLGCATFVCSDKTGTLTENKMTVTEIYLPRGDRISVGGLGFDLIGGFKDQAGRSVRAAADPDLPLLFQACLACNDADLVKGPGGKVQGLGDPTEVALVVLAVKAGLDPETQRKDLPRVHELPFDSVRKRMTTVHRRGNGLIGFTKGAPDLLLQHCTRFRDLGAELSLDDGLRAQLLDELTRLGANGLRVLALTYRFLARDQMEDSEKDLVLLGLVGMRDPVRREAREAVATCLEAGITPVMITGDFPQTALSVAAELGLDSRRAVTGAEMELMSQEELGRALTTAQVFARVLPEHKLRIVDALRSRGEVVAMTGDGVNDAPALRSADIGVAMGVTGTEVAKGASDMVLADDNFATILAAIEEGRVIFENIRKAVIYLLSCNIGELLLFFLAILAGLPRPLVPVQILLINLVTDGLPALAVGVEPREYDVMRARPRDPREGILNGIIILKMLVVSLGIAAAALIPFIWLLDKGIDLTLARTAAFATLGMAELWRALSNRSERSHWWRMPLFSNRQLLLAILSSAAFILAALYVSPLMRIFQTARLDPSLWAVIGLSSLIPMLVAEGIKPFGRART